MVRLEGELVDLAIMGVGAGASGAVAGWLKKVLPGVTEDIATVVAGGALYYFGDRIHPMVKKFGAGVLISGIGTFAKGIIPAVEVGEGGEGGGGSSSSSTSDTLASLAEAQANQRAVYS